MVPRLPKPFRLVFRRGSDGDRAADIAAVTLERSKEVEFVAYGEDCLLSGHLPMTADRLTDLLNAHEQYVLVDVLVQSLLDGRAVEVHELSIAREEILLVQTAGPRGNPARRRRTRQHPVAVQLGPYHVRGYLHVLPGSDPIDALRRRKAMVPLTEAWVEYSIGTAKAHRHLSSLVFNRELMDWAVEATDDEIEFPELPVGDEARGPLVKDFTGSLLTEPLKDVDAGAATA